MVGSPLYIQVFDAAATPANGAIPIYRDVLKINEHIHFEISEPQHLRLGTGCVVALSTTLGTLTLAGAYMHCLVMYEGQV
jgi:hypothetical protein